MYKIYFIPLGQILMRSNMETVIRRKNIDLPVDVLQKLSLMAVAQGRSLKSYIEQVLISKADSISIEIKESPSPSGDAWFDVPENMSSVKKGMAELKEGQGKEYSVDEIKSVLGI